MSGHIKHTGSFEALDAADSYVDEPGGYLDYDAVGGYAQVGAKGPGSIGLKLRTVLAGVVVAVMTFSAAGVATTAGAMAVGGHLTAVTDNVSDLGASGANRFRDGFFSRNIVFGGSITGSGASLTALNATQLTSGTIPSARVAGAYTSITGLGAIQFTGNITATDNTYDIGATGANRFRDLWLSRNAVIGGTFGVSGASTLSGGATIASPSAGSVAATFNGLYSASGTVDLSVWARNAAAAVAMRLRYDDTATNMRFGTSTAHDWVLERNGSTIITLGATQTTIASSTVQVGAALNFAGITDSFVRLSRSSTTLQVELGAGGDWGDFHARQITASGHMLAGTDASYDIGASGANRFRNMYLSGNITNGGTFVMQSGTQHYFDGGGDTYIYESAANVLNFQAGGNAALLLGIGGAYFPVNPTTANAANAYLDGGNNNYLYRSTSSLRYKQWIGPMSVDRARSIVLGLNADGVVGRGAGLYRSMAPRDNHDRIFFGFNAERGAEVDDALVQWGADGEPDGFAYERMTVPHNILLGNHESRIAALEARLAA